MRSAWWSTIGILMLLGNQFAAAQTAEDIRKFAKDKKALTRHELTVYRLHLASPVLTKYDKNLNGRLDPNEAAQVTKDAEKELATGSVSARSDEILLRAGNRQKVPVEELAKLNPAPAKKAKFKLPVPVYIRKDRIDLGIVGFAANTIPTSKAQGARVSYSHDGITKEDVWTVDARVSAVLASEPVEHGTHLNRIPQLTAYAVVPWVDIRRRTSSDPTAKQTDKLAVGADAAFEIFDGPFGGVSYLTLAPSFQTDRLSQASIFDLAAHFETTGAFGMGTFYYPLPNTLPELKVTWHAGLDTVYRDVQAPGAFVLPGTEFTWTGGWIQSKVCYDFDSNCTFMLTVRYMQYYDWINRRDAGLFETDLAYRIDPAGITSVSINYKHGRDWSTFGKFDLLTAGLNFKL